MRKLSLLLPSCCFFISSVVLAYTPNNTPFSIEGLLQIQNNSSYDMVQSKTHSYQMDLWDLPTGIGSGHLESGIFGFKPKRIDANDEAGDVYYQIACPNGKTDELHIMAHLRSTSPFVDIIQEGQHNCIQVTAPGDNVLGIPWDNGAPKIVIADIDTSK